MKRYIFIIMLIVASMLTIMQKHSWAVPILDLNDDGFVNEDDRDAFNAILASGSGGYDPDADYNNNGRIDFIDLQLFNNYLRDYTPTVQTQAVPEPATLALMGIGLLALSGMSLRRRNRKK